MYNQFINRDFCLGLAALTFLLNFTNAQAQNTKNQMKASSTSTAQFSRGLGTKIVSSLMNCVKKSRPSPVGKIISEDAMEWTVPAKTHFLDGPKAADLYNDCGGKVLGGSKNFNLQTVDVIDLGGEEEFIAYIFADNYFELYVNGQLIAVDPVPFTPFNSNVVRFKSHRPFTMAFKLVDWEENLGLGSERARGKAFRPGDGGLVAHIKSSTGETVAITDASWKAQTFYTSPLKNRSCLREQGFVRDSSNCDIKGVADATDFSAAFWPVDDNWAHPDFDDDIWPYATIFTNETVGVDNKRAFTDFKDIFDDPAADAQFIWSSNLILDNLVLVRKRID